MKWVNLIVENRKDGRKFMRHCSMLGNSEYYFLYQLIILFIIYIIIYYI